MLQQCRLQKDPKCPPYGRGGGERLGQGERKRERERERERGTEGERGRDRERERERDRERKKEKTRDRERERETRQNDCATVTKAYWRLFVQDPCCRRSVPIPSPVPLATRLAEFQAAVEGFAFPVGKYHRELLPVCRSSAKYRRRQFCFSSEL